MELDAGPETAAVRLACRGIATAVAPAGGLTPIQESLLSAVVEATTGVRVDLAELEPIGPDDLAAGLAGIDQEARRHIVQHMLLGELILRPIPLEVAVRVDRYATALGFPDDQFVRVARRLAQGAANLAWVDLHGHGFVQHWEAVRTDHLKARAKPAHQLAPGSEDPELAACWAAFQALPAGSLGRRVWEMYVGRGFELPGAPGGASAYLAQHDFVHVLADYGTNLDGEMEVFALIGRADPAPKGFAWLTTLIGLFETGYVAGAGFFDGDIGTRHLDTADMHRRLADALRRGAAVCDAVGTDLMDVDYHALAELPVEDAAARVGLPPKSPEAVAAGSAGLFDRAGMSVLQLAVADAGGIP